GARKTAAKPFQHLVQRVSDAGGDLWVNFLHVDRAAHPAQHPHVTSVRATASLVSGKLLPQVGHRMKLKPAVDPRVLPSPAGKGPDFPRFVVERRMAPGRSATDNRHFLDGLFQGSPPALRSAFFRWITSKSYARKARGVTASTLAPGAPLPAPPSLGRHPIVPVEHVDLRQDGFFRHPERAGPGQDDLDAPLPRHPQEVLDTRPLPALDALMGQVNAPHTDGVDLFQDGERQHVRNRTAKAPAKGRQRLLQRIADAVWDFRVDLLHVDRYVEALEKGHVTFVGHPLDGVTDELGAQVL